MDAGYILFIDQGIGYMSVYNMRSYQAKMICALPCLLCFSEIYLKSRNQKHQKFTHTKLCKQKSLLNIVEISRKIRYYKGSEFELRKAKPSYSDGEPEVNDIFLFPLLCLQFLENDTFMN